MTISTKLKIFSVIAVLGGPFAAFEGYKDKQLLAEMDKSGVTVPGEIVGGGSSGGRRSRSYELIIGFSPQGATTPTKKSFKVTSSFYKAHTSDSSITDPNVQVRYLPAKPDTAIVVGGSSEYTALFPLGIGAGVIGLLLGGFMFTRKEQA